MQNISHGYMKHAIRLVIIAYHFQNLFVAPTSPAPSFVYLFLNVCVDSQPDEESNNIVLKVDFSLKICVQLFALANVCSLRKWWNCDACEELVCVFFVFFVGMWMTFHACPSSKGAWIYCHKTTPFFLISPLFCFCSLVARSSSLHYNLGKVCL